MRNFESSPNLASLPFVEHGFFTRNKGYSDPPYRSLNLSLHVGDSPELVKKNRLLALHELGLMGKKLFVPHLVHGKNVLLVNKDHCPQTIAKAGADALITSENGIVLGVTYADCVPILLACEDRPLIAAIHAGWRGLEKEIIYRTVRIMRESYGVMYLNAAIGPAISQQGYFVGPDVLKVFNRKWQRFVFEHDKGGYVDLSSIAEQQLANAGVKSIKKVGGFTDLSPHKYFSHRREFGKTGRHMAMISLNPAKKRLRRP